MIKGQKTADLWLALVAACWGTTYILTDRVLLEMAPMAVNAVRFLAAFAVLAVLFRRQLRQINRVTLRYVAIIGSALCATYVCYNYGLMRTTESNASFLCAMPVLFTPILELLLFRRLPERRFWPVMVLCVVGLGLMILRDNLTVSVGDALCIVLAVFYSLDLIFTGRAVADERVNPVTLSTLVMGFVGVVTTVLSLLLEGGRRRLPTSGEGWVCVLFLGVVCTGAAFAVQTLAQRRTTASHVGVIFTIEPLFASILAFFITKERLAARSYVGMALILAGLVLMELPLPGGKARSAAVQLPDAEETAGER